MPEHPLAPFRQAYAERFAPPGGPGVVAVLGSCVPVELVLAARLTPRRLFPHALQATPLADVTMEPVFDGAIRSLYDQFLAGRFAEVPLAVLPRATEGHLQLYYFLQEARRHAHGSPVPPLHLFDLLKSPHWATRQYVRGQLEALWSALLAVRGAAPAARDADAMAAAIAFGNHQRRLLRQVNALRRDRVPRLSGSDLLQIIGAAGVLPPAEHVAAMGELLHAAPGLPPLAAAAPRVLVKGSGHDDLRFYGLLEACGAHVVADDHATGEPAFEGLVDESAPPLDALADHCHRQLPTLRSMPQSEQDRRLLRTVAEAQADGAVFFIEEHDDTLGWDYPVQKRLLDAQGIPSVCLLHQSYRTPDAAAQRAVLAPWLQGLAARRAHRAEGAAA